MGYRQYSSSGTGGEFSNDIASKLNFGSINASLLTGMVRHFVGRLS